jgi:hypothetical protein
MAAPAPTARTTPTGFKMPDGWQTLVTFATQPALQIWETTVKPPGLDGGEPINTTTMHNSQWRTFIPKHLVTQAPMTVTAFYDPDVHSVLLTLLNRQDTITVRHPDGSTEAFYGALNKAEKGDNKEGEPPTLTLTITPTNWDNATGVEAGPTFTAAAGT